MLKSVYQTIHQYDLIPPGSGVVAGVSGGADSLALLHGLNTLRASHRCILYVATLDHGLRGAAGAEDAQFVVEQAGKLRIPTLVGQADVRALAEQKGLGIEAAARLARYNFLAAAAQHFGVKRVAVAHHAGDQAETVLMHLIRGSGIHGLGGMYPQARVPGHPDLILIRPLLHVTRSEIETYLHEQGLTPRQDATNQDRRYLRNYIRHETLSHLERLNPNVQQALAQLAETAQVEDDYLQGELEAFIEQYVTVDANRLSFNRAHFSSLHPALQRRLVIWAARQIKSEIERLTYSHILEAVAIGVSGKLGNIALLTEEVRLRGDYEALVVEREDAPLPLKDQPLLMDGEEIPVAVPGQTILPGESWALVSTEGEDWSPKSPQNRDNEMKYARLALPEHAVVKLRTRREGDRFRPFGLGGHSQKLNRWMINRKIWRPVRVHIPLLCVEDEIAAIFVNSQWFVSESYAVKDNSRRVVYFHFLQNS